MLILGHIGITAGFFYLLNTKLKKNIDYAFLVIGSLLPDIIDKPLGNIILNDVLDNGRIIGHTLLFAFVLASIGLYKRRVIYLAAGAFVHLLLDRMWGDPKTLLWPLLGGFERKNFQFTDLIASFYADPVNYMGEIIGFFAIACLAARHRYYIRGKINSLASAFKNFSTPKSRIYS